MNLLFPGLLCLEPSHLWAFIHLAFDLLIGSSFPFDKNLAVSLLGLPSLAFGFLKPRIQPPIFLDFPTLYPISRPARQGLSLAKNSTSNLFGLASGLQTYEDFLLLRIWPLNMNSGDLFFE